MLNESQFAARHVQDAIVRLVLLDPLNPRYPKASINLSEFCDSLTSGSCLVIGRTVTYSGKFEIPCIESGINDYNDHVAMRYFQFQFCTVDQVPFLIFSVPTNVVHPFQCPVSGVIPTIWSYIRPFNIYSWLF